MKKVKSAGVGMSKAVAFLFVAVSLLVLGYIGPSVSAAMSDASAMGKAMTIWGPHAAISKYRKTGATYWSMQVGCELDDGTFHIVATGVNTWEDSFGRVDMTHNGIRYITAIATQGDGVKGSSPTIMVYACNALGLPVAEIDREHMASWRWKKQRQLDVFLNTLMP